MTIIPFTNPNQLPRNVGDFKYRAWSAPTPEQAEAAFHAAFPHYDAPVGFWHTPLKTLHVLMAWEAQVKP